MATNRWMTGLHGNVRRIVVAAAVVVTLAFPALADARKSGRGSSLERGKVKQATERGWHHRPNPVVTYTFKGVVASVNLREKSVLVSVKHVNRNQRRFSGHDTSFDLSDARLNVANVNHHDKHGLRKV